MIQLDWKLQKVLDTKSADALKRGFDYETVDELLRHFPRTYASRGEFTSMEHLRHDEHATIVARVTDVTVRPMRKRRGHIAEVTVTDGSGQARLTFFNQRWLAEKLKRGTVALFAGKVNRYRGALELTHPDYQVIGWGELDATAQAAAEMYADQIIPIYPATAKLPSWRIAMCIEVVLNQLDDLVDPVPFDVIDKRGLPGMTESFHDIHRPKDLANARRAKERFRYEEAFVLQAELARRRASTAALPATPRVATEGGLVDVLDASLPFELTGGQREVGRHIAEDMAQIHPMHRLLQGEVGAGKTVVALRAMLATVDTGGQAALLAPTEVLAQQHFRTLSQLMGPLGQRGMLGGSDIGTRISLVTGSMPTKARREALLDIGVGDAGLVIGTHALLEEQVQFFDLGLVVVDEQHRFGVEQRAALTAKSRDGSRPHVLVMTATPIPRTIAMTVFGDLEISSLAELPQGRADVVTHVVPLTEKPHYLQRAWERVREEAEAGNRVYIVCPRIGDDENGAGGELANGDDEGRRPVAVLDLAAELRAGPLADVSTEILHGRMSADDKDAAMRRFASGESPVMIATTVIEVGVDVATASMMVVMDADRFGVSQLHQLRGRIGRGDIPGVCLLVTEADDDSTSLERLRAVAGTRDGFELSQVDLEQRREGNVLGAAQSGYRSSLRVLRVVRDADVIEQAREDATAVVEVDSTLAGHPALDGAIAAMLREDQSEYLDQS